MNLVARPRVYIHLTLFELEMVAEKRRGLSSRLAYGALLTRMWPQVYLRSRRAPLLELGYDLVIRLECRMINEAIDRLF